jgi:hypothetical protein
LDSGGNLGTARRELGSAGTQTAGLGFGGTTGSNTAVTEEYNGTSWTGGGNLNTTRHKLQDVEFKQTLWGLVELQDLIQQQQNNMMVQLGQAVQVCQRLEKN